MDFCVLYSMKKHSKIHLTSQKKKISLLLLVLSFILKNVETAG